MAHGQICLAKVANQQLNDVPVSPFVIDSVYQASVVYKLLAISTGERVYWEMVEAFKGGLMMFGFRWKVAGKLSWLRREISIL